MDAFLKREKQQWKCPRCGGVLCVHTNRCYTCNP
jgi:ribosomal protein S27AE